MENTTLEIQELLEVVDLNTFSPEKVDMHGVSEDAVVEALWASQGNIAYASKLLDIPYACLYNHINKNEKLKEYLKRATDIHNNLKCDVLQELAFHKALAGDTTLIWKLLCSYGRERGFGDISKVALSSDIPPHVSELLLSLKTIRENAITETRVCDKELSQENKSARGCC